MTGIRARWMRFTAAGAAGFVVQFTVLVALTTFTGLHYAAATAIAVEAAILVNYAWHVRWTWSDRPASSGRDQWQRLARFNALTAATSIAGSVVITVLLVESLGVPLLAANIASVAVLSGVNFVGANTLVFRGTAMALAWSTASVASADTLEALLQPRTIQGFARYVAAVEGRIGRELKANAPFLAIERQPPDRQAAAMTALRRGEVIVTHGDRVSEVAIDGGMINHWRGTALVPGVSLDALLKTLREPQADQHQQEDVLRSRVENRGGDRQKLFLRLRRTKIVTVVYDTEYDVDYRRLAPDRALSNSVSTKIVEIENAGTPQERALPEGNDHGYMWRLNSYWRYQQVDGGVIVEVESVTLSRDLPPIIGALIRPIINSTARESITRTLASMRARFAH
jgi:putative flippase GtrA